MGELQWALLIVCAVLVVLIYLFSRRARRDDAGAPREETAAPAATVDTGQSDLFVERPAAPPENFDEFGVGKPRSRGAGDTVDPAAARPRGTPPSVGSLLQTANPKSPAAPAAAGASKVVVLIVAPTEETDILGPNLHQALAAQGLKFGEGEIYHRTIGGKVVYSVAGLIKPGKLVPAEAAGFSTRGLTVALQLPGPVAPEVAFDDMASTARALATALKSDVFDARKQQLTDEVVASMRGEIRDWARAARSA